MGVGGLTGGSCSAPGDQALAGKQRKEEEEEEREMATGGITTLPSSPEDGGGSGFPPGSFKDPKRLYCKNGGFFLRIRADGVVDGIREKTDPHSKAPPSPPLVSKSNREAKKHGGAMRLFQFGAFNAPLVGVRRAAGGKFNGCFRRNAPLAFTIGGLKWANCSSGRHSE